MQTLILPGFSQKNRLWADDITAALQSNFSSIPVYWSHWKTPTDNLQDFGLPEETKKVISLANNNAVNIVAKSIGTFLTVYLLQHNLIQINKFILCGIPIKALGEEQKLSYKVLTNFSPSQVEIIHNQDDVVGSAEQIKSFIKTINPKLEVMVKPRADHSYPYSEDFIKFLE